MIVSKRRYCIAFASALYLYFLLPATATFFYELYHLTQVDFVYWGYSAFKAAGYYFSQWQYRLPTSILLAVLIIVIPSIIRKGKGQ